MKRKPSDESFYRLLNKRLSQIASLRLEVLRESTETILQESSSRGMREDSLRQFQQFFQKAIPAGITALLEGVEKHFESDPEVPFDAITIKKLITKNSANWFAFAEQQYRKITSSVGMPELYDRIRGENAARHPIPIQQTLETGLTIIEETIASSRSNSPASQIALRRNTKAQGSQFPTPENATWEDFTMKFTDETTLMVNVGAVKKYVTYAEMGFKNEAKKHASPKKQWLLLKLCATKGSIGWPSLSDTRQKNKISQHPSEAELLVNEGEYKKKVERMKQQVSSLSETLCKYFGLTTKPIHRYNPRKGWVPRFKILPE